MTGQTLDQLKREISDCAVCSEDLVLGPRPVVRASQSARLLIIGQAPGTKVHKTGIPWNDPSGDRLRLWTGLDWDVFYDEDRVAIMPMGFCYPGRNEISGADNPPRPECAPLWHARLLPKMKNIELTLLVGGYAQTAYLGKNSIMQKPLPKPKTMTDTVRNWQAYGPDVIPLPHPSWRVSGWLTKNNWFEDELIPELQHKIKMLSGFEKTSG